MRRRALTVPVVMTHFKPLSRTLFLAVVLSAIGSIACAGGEQDAKPMATVTVEEAHQRLAAEAKPLVVDVREPDEFAAGHIEGALLAPLGNVEEGVKDVAKDREVLLICHSGRRSAKAYERLAAIGYTKLWNVEGGMVAWEKAQYPVAK